MPWVLGKVKVKAGEGDRHFMHFMHRQATNFPSLFALFIRLPTLATSFSLSQEIVLQADLVIIQDRLFYLLQGVVQWIGTGWRYQSDCHGKIARNNQRPRCPL